MARTIDNLMKMISSNSVSSIRYLAFAEAADEEGYPGAAKVFSAVARAQKYHALSHFRATGFVDTTFENLKQTFEEETYDYKTAYPAMVRDAVTDDALEARHSLEYGMSIGPVIAGLINRALSDLHGDPEGSYFVCPLCGNIEFGNPPEKCPFCGVAAKHFDAVS